MTAPALTELEKARQEIQEALGWLAAGLTVWIDQTSDPQQPKREVVLSMLRQGESAIDRLVAAAQEDGKQQAWSGSDDFLPHALVQEREAAARLAGRLEQADMFIAAADKGMHLLELKTWWSKERDRLRREAGK